MKGALKADTSRTMKSRPHPPARPHGVLQEVLPNLYVVAGTVAMPGPVPMRFSQAMTVVKNGERLVLVNAMRLDDAGLAALDKLGKVTDVIRLAAFHGASDPFYRERYQAKVWALAGAPYMPGFDPMAEPYFEPDVRFTADTPLPIDGAKVHVFRSRPPEALLHLPMHGGTVIAGDALQNMEAPDTYYNWLGSLVMRLMGFLKPTNVGPGWLKQAKPPASDLKAVLELTPFANVLPAHGRPVLGEAQQKYRPAIEKAVSAMS